MERPYVKTKKMLLLCTRTRAHTMGIFVVAVVRTENKVVLQFFWQKGKEAMQRMYPEFDRDVDCVTSDGAKSTGAPTVKIWPDLKAWPQCLDHVVRNLQLSPCLETGEVKLFGPESASAARHYPLCRLLW